MNDTRSTPRSMSDHKSGMWVIAVTTSIMIVKFFNNTVNIKNIFHYRNIDIDKYLYLCYIIIQK